jgi:hypothetical protein
MLSVSRRRSETAVGSIIKAALGEESKAGAGVLLDETMDFVDGLLDGRVRPGRGRSPFYAVPFLRTNFLPAMGATVALAVALAWLKRRW